MDQDAVGTANANPPAELHDYDFVRLRREVCAGGATYPAGARGAIVHSQADGVGCEVEFEVPAFRVPTLTARDLIPDHA